MKMIKMSLMLALCAVMFLPHSGCSEIRYADGVACETVGEGIRETLGAERELSSFSESELVRELDLDGGYDDFYSAYSTEVEDIDEVGVLHAPTAKAAKELAEECREYIDEKREEMRAFVASYAPHEVPKLDSAEVRRFGNYVVYTVLDRDVAERVFETVKEKLK